MCLIFQRKCIILTGNILLGDYLLTKYCYWLAKGDQSVSGWLIKADFLLNVLWITKADYSFVPVVTSWCGDGSPSTLRKAWSVSQPWLLQALQTYRPLSSFLTRRMVNVLLDRFRSTPGEKKDTKLWTQCQNHHKELSIRKNLKKKTKDKNKGIISTVSLLDTVLILPPLRR